MNYQLQFLKFLDIEDREYIENIPYENVLINLMKRSLHAHLVNKGLNVEKNQLFFPKGLLDNDKIHFKSYFGKKSTIQMVGVRTWKKTELDKEMYQYHISPSFQIKKRFNGQYIAILSVGLFITDLKGEPLSPKKAHSRGRHLRREWYNHKWFSIYLGLLSFLSDGNNEIIIGNNSKNNLILSAQYLSNEIPYSVVEKKDN